MSIDVAAHQARTYTVSTPVYQGPLDLLLQLIERAELDINSLALAQVTEQYLQHLKNLEHTAAEEVSAFLVIAAKLIQIKSESLLPRPPQREEGEEDPGEALAQQLKAYKRFKELSLFLEQREAANLRTYLRLAPGPQLESSADLSGIELADLVAAAYAIFAQEVDKPALGTVVTAPRITIREKIAHITRFLRKYQRGSFSQLIGDDPLRLEVVVTFLAMLELVKRHLVNTHQAFNFDDIEIEIQDTWEESAEFELEFGE
jgi:segregation and condensation protein A